MITIACGLRLHEQCVDSFIEEKKRICQCECHEGKRFRKAVRQKYNVFDDGEARGDDWYRGDE